MAIDLRWSWMFVVFLMILWKMVATEQTLVEGVYKIVEPEQNITGKIIAEIKTKTKLHCPLSCTINEECTAYRFNAAEEMNCGLIEENSTHATFLPSPESHLYKRDECYSTPCQNGGTCNDGKMMFTCDCPSNFQGLMCETECNQAWGCPPVVYRSLDSGENLQLMNGAQIVVGKVGNAVKTNRDHDQYVDLGDLSIACITRPETCGPEGAAISFWFKLNSCGGTGGLISSTSIDTTGFTVACNSFLISFYLPSEDEVVSKEGAVEISFSQWYHFVCNVPDIGDEERIKLFYDGSHYSTNNQVIARQSPSGSGRVLVGRVHANLDNYFTSVELDELLFFFNRALEEQQVQAWYQQYD